jgi:hypothetical protein
VSGDLQLALALFGATSPIWWAVLCSLWRKQPPEKDERAKPLLGERQSAPASPVPKAPPSTGSTGTWAHSMMVQQQALLELYDLNRQLQSLQQPGWPHPPPWSSDFPSSDYLSWQNKR